MSLRDPQILGEDMIDNIQKAFGQQTIPEQPDASETWDWLQSETIRDVSTPWQSNLSDDRVAQIMATVSVLAAGIMLAIAFWRTDVETVKSHMPTQIEDPLQLAAQLQVGETGGTNTPRSTSSDQANEHSSSESVQQAGSKEADETRLQSRLLETIQVANGCIRTRNNQPDILAAYFAGNRTQDSQPALAAALTAMGVPRGIRSVSNGVSRERSWLLNNNQRAFTYGVNYDDLLLDLKRFLKAYFQDDVLDGILDGIHRDQHGPQVDLRGRVLPQFLNELVLVVDRQQDAGGDRMMVVIPVRDVNVVLDAVRRMYDKSPKGSVEKFKNVTVFVSSPTEEAKAQENPHLGPQESWRRAACVVKKHLLVGDLQTIRAALDRLLK